MKELFKLTGDILCGAIVWLIMAVAIHYSGIPGNIVPQHILLNVPGAAGLLAVHFYNAIIRNKNP